MTQKPSVIGRNRQFNLCERINRARALIGEIYNDTGATTAEEAEKLMAGLFDQEFAKLVQNVHNQGEKP